MRAVSRKEVNVAFVPDGGSLLGQEARITVPARDLPVEDVSRVRGEADSMALKLRHHDRKTHLRRVPRGEAARAIFEAVEQVRVEALGATKMVGVADNLSALWRQRSDQRGHARIKTKEDAPIADVIGLIAREQLLGAAPPESAKAMVDMWRADIESAAGRDFQKLRDALSNQESFAAPPRQLIRDLKLGDETADLQDDDNEDCRTRRTPTASRTRPATTRAIRARPRATAPRARRPRTRPSRTTPPRPSPTRPRPRCRWARATRRSRAAPSVRGCRRARSPTSPPGQQYHAYSNKFDGARPPSTQSAERPGTPPLEPDRSSRCRASCRCFRVLKLAGTGFQAPDPGAVAVVEMIRCPSTARPGTAAFHSRTGGSGQARARRRADAAGGRGRRADAIGDRHRCGGPDQGEGYNCNKCSAHHLDGEGPRFPMLPKRWAGATGFSSHGIARIAAPLPRH